MGNLDWGCSRALKARVYGVLQLMKKIEREAKQQKPKQQAKADFGSPQN